MHYDDNMKNTTILIAVILLLFIAGCTMKKTQTDEKMAITVFAADKADAILIQTAEGAVLIDAGLSENSEDLTDAMEDRGVTSLDALIITHYDQDHVGGADTVVENFDVEHVYVTYDSKDSDETDSFYSELARAGLQAVEIRGTQVFSIDGAVFTMYGARGGYDHDDSNNSSLIVEVSFGSCTYLFTGDAQDERIAEFLAEYEGNPDFLKVPYHGHYTDGLKQMISALSPRTAVITNGEDEPAKKEMKQTLALLSQKSIDVYETRYGTVTVTCTANGYEITQDLQ